MTEDELIVNLTKLKRRFFRPRVRSRWRQKPCPLATPQQIARAEDQLGFAIPILLKRIYLEVGNGGFGPGKGLVGIENGATDSLGNDLVKGYLARQFRDPEDTGWIWPEKIVPLFELGCAAFSCGDFGSQATPIFEFDPALRRPNEAMQTALRPQAQSLFGLFDRWISGEDVLLPPVDAEWVARRIDVRNGK